MEQRLTLANGTRIEFTDSYNRRLAGKVVWSYEDEDGSVVCVSVNPDGNVGMGYTTQIHTSWGNVKEVA